MNNGSVALVEGKSVCLSSVFVGFNSLASEVFIFLHLFSIWLICFIKNNLELNDLHTSLRIPDRRPIEGKIFGQYLIAIIVNT